MTPRLSRYDVLGRLASGGMAEVWLARMKGVAGFEKLVVLKTILPELLDEPQFVTMFINEARLAALLAHPNCVQIFDLGEEGDVLFIAMEYVAGFTLSRVLQRARRQGVAVPEPVLARILMDACSGLDSAHRLKDREGRPLNLVHRDISPDNLLISFSGQVKVADFGIAKAATPALLGARTHAGAVKGKHGYIAPEYLLGGEVDGRADLFALGVVLYRALTGVRPFVGDNQAAISLAVVERTPPPPVALNPSVNPALSAVAMKALEKDPARRFDSARALRQALEVAVARAADAEEVGAFMESLWPEDDPERAGLLALASGRATEDRSSPVLAVVSETSPSAEVVGPALPGPGELQAPAPGVPPEAAPPPPEEPPLELARPLRASAPPVTPAPEDTPPAPEHLADELDAPPRRRWAWGLLLLLVLAGAGAFVVQRRPQVIDQVFGRRGPRAGQLVVTMPGLKVLDGTLELGTSPLAVDLPVGPHTLRLVSKARGVDRKVQVELVAGQVVQLTELPADKRER